MTGAFVVQGLENLVGENGVGIVESFERHAPTSGQPYHRIIMKLSDSKLLRSSQYWQVRCALEKPSSALYCGEDIYVSNKWGKLPRPGVLPKDAYVTLIVSNNEDVEDRKRPVLVKAVAEVIEKVYGALHGITAKKPSLNAQGQYNTSHSNYQGGSFF